MADSTGQSREDELWKQKVRSVDDSLKSLRGASKPPERSRTSEKKTERPQEEDKKHRGLFSFLHPKQSPAVVPIERSRQGE